MATHTQPGSAKMRFLNMMNRVCRQPESYDKRWAYNFGKILGVGAFGIVREANGPEGKCAVKIIRKDNVRGNEQAVYCEVAMLRNMDNPHIIKFHEWFESKDKHYIITELAAGGELFDRICGKGKFAENAATGAIRQVLEAVNYLHRMDVIHRDLKPENLLYLTRNPDSPLVLADFGTAEKLDSPSGVLTTMVGSFGYAAPEVMEKKEHSKPADMWSLGVITYTLLCGYNPFRSETMGDLINECRNESLFFDPRYWSDVNGDAKDFVKCLLKADPRERLTSEQALGHAWLAVRE